MTHISFATALDGDLVATEDLSIDGQVTGSVHVRGGLLTIGQQATLGGTARAERVLVYGTVRGTISASDRIELLPSAVVTGDLSAPQVVVTDGATLNGRVDMGRRTIAAKVAQYMAEHRAADA